MLGVGVLLLVVAGILSLVGTVIFAVAAFRVSLMWGLLVLFVPFAGLVFLVKYWAQAKQGFLLGLAGSAIGVIAFFALSAGMASKAKAQLGDLGALMQSQTQAEAARQREDLSPSTRATLRTVPETATQSQGAPAAQPALTVRSDGDLRGLPDVPTELSDPGEIRMPELSRHLGEELLFVEKDGGSIWGKLVSVSPRALRIERRLHGGSVQYDVPLADIRTVRADG